MRTKDLEDGANILMTEGSGVITRPLNLGGHPLSNVGDGGELNDVVNIKQFATALATVATLPVAEADLTLNYPTHANNNDPSAGQKAALAGTNGTPSVSNKYVTNSDTRNSDARTPVGTTLTENYIWVGSHTTNIAAAVAVSGDVGLVSSGAMSIIAGIQNHFIPCEVPTGAINNKNKAFTLANTPITAAGLAAIILWKNGVVMAQGVGIGYTVSGNTITYTTAPRLGDTHYCQYWK